MKNLFAFVLGCLVIATTISGAVAADELYRIGPGDVLEISVWKDEELSRQVVVPPDGFVSFPLVESINVNNLTVAGLRNTLAKKLSEYIPDATVTVMLMEINSLKAYVIGKVNAPGEFPIKLDTNVMQILAMAGGLTPFASKGNIQILRQNKDSIVKIPFDYGDLEKGRNLEQNIILKAGDVIVVP